ncbi:MAG: lipopolysaccharide biosynthesis protein [Phycisphaerae bacterium]|nr:lipopolysaccharide biosynthesis protein [Phycisphaerae bacterium]
MENDALSADGGRFASFRPTGLAQSMGTYLAATVTFRFLNFARILLLTWFMTRQQMGLLNVILMIISVLIPLCSFGLNDAVTRFVPHHEERGTLAAFFRRSLLLVAAVTAATTGLMMIFATRLGELFFAQVIDDPAVRAEFRGDARAMAIMTSVTIALSVAYFYLLAFFKGLRMFSALSRLEVWHAVLFFVGAIAMIYAGRLSALALTALFGGSILLPVAYYGGKLARVIRTWRAQASPLSGAAWERRLLRFSIWTALSGVTWQALQYYATWYLNKTHGNESVAVFGTVQKIAQLILIGAVAVSTVAMTTVTKTWESQGREAAERQLSLAFRGTGIGLFLICAALALGKHWVMKLFRSDYAIGAESLPLQLLFTLLAGYLAFLPGHFALREKTRHAFWAWAAGIVANVLLAFCLARPGRFEAVMAGVAWQRVGQAVAWILAPSFSDPMGLHGAAWCAAAAMMIATVVCVLLVRSEGAHLDRGSYVTLCLPLLLATHSGLLAIGTAAVIITSKWTDLIFDGPERQRMMGFAFGAISHLGRSVWRGRRSDAGRPN